MPDNCWPPCRAHTNTTGRNRVGSRSTDQSDRFSVCVSDSRCSNASSSSTISDRLLRSRKSSSTKTDGINYARPFHIAIRSYLALLSPDSARQCTKTLDSPETRDTATDTERLTAQRRSAPRATDRPCRTSAASCPPDRRQHRQSRPSSTTRPVCRAAQAAPIRPGTWAPCWSSDPMQALPTVDPTTASPRTPPCDRRRRLWRRLQRGRRN